MMWLTKHFCTAVLISIAAWGASPPDAAAALLRVDLDVGSGNTQSGFESWFLSSGGATIGSANFTNSFSYPLAVGNSLDVTMTTSSDTYTRLYSTVTSPPAAVDYNLLLRDLLFFNNRRGGNNYFQVELDGLLAGSYEFTAWHNASSRVGNPATTDVLLSVGGSPLADTGLEATLFEANPNGILPAGAPSTSTLSFVVPNDGDSVVIRYANPTSHEFGLNAFQLVPEPGTFLLLLSALAGGLLVRRRRAR